MKRKGLKTAATTLKVCLTILISRYVEDCYLMCKWKDVVLLQHQRRWMLRKHTLNGVELWTTQIKNIANVCVDQMMSSGVRLQRRQHASRCQLEKQAIGNDRRQQETGSDRQQETGSDRQQAIGSDRQQEAGSNERRTINGHRQQETGSNRQQETGSDRQQETGSNERRTIIDCRQHVRVVLLTIR
jgi:hypothetical protein